MPIPKPNKNETEQDFVSRCVPILKKNDPKKNQNQIVAICYTEYSKFKKARSIKENLSSFKDM